MIILRPVVLAVVTEPAEQSKRIRTVSEMWIPPIHVNIKSNLANDPKIFLSWIGTDRSGDYMLSQALRISRFTEYAVGNAYADAVKIFKN